MEDLLLDESTSADLHLIGWSPHQGLSIVVASCCCCCCCCCYYYYYYYYLERLLEMLLKEIVY
jgi:hypothetical protein